MVLQERTDLLDLMESREPQGKEDPWGWWESRGNMDSQGKMDPREELVVLVLWEQRVILGSRETEDLKELEV